MEREKESNKSRFLRLIVESHGSTILDGDSAPFYGFYPAQLQRLICLVEQETLERAALICDEMREHWSAYKDTALLNGDVELSNAASGEPRAAEALANLIRNLKDSQ